MNNIVNLSKEFLHATQRGDLDKLINLSEQWKIDDWTIFRHESSGDTALHISAREGYLNIVKYLCDNFSKPEFKIDVANKDMKRPLHEAAQFVKTDVLEFLVTQGIILYLNKWGKSAVFDHFKFNSILCNQG